MLSLRRAFLHRALKVHYKVLQRDIKVGRNLGNSILRWLDQTIGLDSGSPLEKPSSGASSSISMTKQCQTPPN